MDEKYGEMPQSLCGFCVRKAKASYAFVQQAQEAHQKLWCAVQDVNNADESKTTDCLQESQIDIQNCLEIKMEEEECGQINRRDSEEFQIEKLKEYDICTTESKDVANKDVEDK